MSACSNAEYSRGGMNDEIARRQSDKLQSNLLHNDVLGEFVENIIVYIIS